jgi:hypothetical protein
VLFVYCTDNSSYVTNDFIEFDATDFVAVEKLSEAFGLKDLQIDKTKKVLASKINNSFTIPVKYTSPNTVGSRDFQLICIEGDIRRPKFSCNSGIGLCNVSVRFLGACFTLGEEDYSESQNLGTAALKDDNVVITMQSSIDWSAR